MVNGVKAPELVIHQALHGYADGHRQLSISIELKAQDNKTLMTMSDSSGPGVRFPETGYLTGYPLIESGYYVLARTWPAPEMPRPGCVWTHSLLIDFADLATLVDAGDLVRLFHRPKSESYVDYNSAFVYTPSSTYGSKPRYISKADRLLSALYNEPKSRIVSAGTGELDEQLVLDIWCQQWPRLRRNFWFCTCAATDRSTKAGSFDLQFLPIDARIIRSRFSELLDADTQPITDTSWLRCALDDLLFPDKDGLRTFLRQLGADVTVGRDAFPLLCRLHILLSQKVVTVEGLRESIQLFESQFRSGQGRLARNAIIHALITNIERLDEVATKFLIDNLDSIIASADESTVQRIGMELWMMEPRLISQIFERGDVSSRELVEKTIAHIPMESLAAYAHVVPSLTKIIIGIRPNILSNTIFWKNMGEFALSVLAYVSHDEPNSITVAYALIEAGRYDLVRDAFEVLGGNSIGAALLSAPSNLIDETWLVELASRPKIVSSLLCSNIQFQRNSLVRLAERMRLVDVSDQYDRDPWFTAWGNGVGDVPRKDQAYFFAYILARALNGNPYSAADVMVCTFHFLHTALEENKVPKSAWALLEWRLHYLFFEPDPCAKLRASVVWQFVEKTHSPTGFLQLTPDDRVFTNLVEFAARSYQGRKYLKLVLEAAKDSEDHRYELIERVI